MLRAEHIYNDGKDGLLFGNCCAAAPLDSAFLNPLFYRVYVALRCLQSSPIFIIVGLHLKLRQSDGVDSSLVVVAS